MEKNIVLSRSVECANLSKEEFVNLMSADLNAAREEYKEKNYPIKLEKHNEFEARCKKSWEDNAWKIAKKNWKTLKYQQKFVDKKMTEYKSGTFKFYGLEYFDMDLWPDQNGIYGECVLHCDPVSNNQLEQCYDRIKDNKYFKSATGWNLVDYPSSRPQIELILPEDMQKMYEKEEKDLEDDIRRFYANTTYFGD